MDPWETYALFCVVGLAALVIGSFVVVSFALRLKGLVDDEQQQLNDRNFRRKP